MGYGGDCEKTILKRQIGCGAESRRHVSNCLGGGKLLQS